MKITQLFTTQEEREIDLDTPAFFAEFGSKIAVYSEDKVVSVTSLTNGWVNVRKSTISDYRNFIDLVTKATKISEEEFNGALQDAILNITGVVIVPNSVTELIPA